ncbi:hypothetical protein CWI37_1760p0010, partial [Hamiltosporidium tvaerminnensis]
DDWIVVFIDQIFLNLKEKAFIYFLKQDLSDIKTDRQKHPFCDEIKEFLETLKNNMVSSVYAVFYIYKIEDSIFESIIAKFLKKYKLEIKHLKGNKEMVFERKIKENILFGFSYFLESALNRYFLGDNGKEIYNNNDTYFFIPKIFIIFFYCTEKEYNFKTEFDWRKDFIPFSESIHIDIYKEKQYKMVVNNQSQSFSYFSNLKLGNLTYFICCF